MKIEQSTLSRFRWLLAALLSASLAVWSAIWVLADLLQSQGITMLYASLNSNPNQGHWEYGWSLLGYARALNPLRAEYPFYQAYFSHNRSQGSSEQEGDFPDYQTRSFEYFNQALKQRPNWGYVWAQLAETRVDNGNRDKETFGALEKALVFAPYEPFVLHIALKVGFMLWDRLDDGLRQKLLSAVRYLLRHDPRSVIETALSFNWSEQLRPLLLDARDIEYLESRLADLNSKYAGTE